jgi:hypothetical protein
MSHPFFGGANYPWSYKPEAGDLHRVLYTAINDLRSGCLQGFLAPPFQLTL